MFTDLIQRIKNTPHVFSLGQYVDVFDNYNSWRMSKIVYVRDQEIKVTFDGWSSKYDETHKMNSNRVAYFRQHTEPYTGAAKYAQRDFQFNHEIEHIQAIIQRMQELIINEFQKIEPQELCQFIRGELYLLIDSLMQENTQYTSQELKRITDFFESFIRFFVQWGKYCLQRIQIYSQGIQAHPSLFYFHLETGIVGCHPEMFDTLTKIFMGFNLQGRTKHFFEKNDTNLMKQYNLTDRYLVQAGFFKYFQDNGGVDIIENLLTWNLGEGDQLQKIPFQIIKNILPVIEAMYKCHPQKQEWIQKIKDIILQRLQNLTLQDLKETNMSIIFQILKEIPKQFGNILIHIAQECECAEVRLAISLIKLQILEKKMKGLKELSDIIERSSKQNIIQNYFNDRKLSQFLKEENLFQILLNEAQHAEILKRAAPILRFLAENQTLSINDIQQLWDAAQNRHETETKNIYEVISDVSRVVNNEQLEFIIQRINKIPQNQVDQYVIGFIRDFTIQSSRNLNRSKNQKQLNSLSLMWELLQDKSEVQSQYMITLMNGFIQCVRVEKEIYQQLCLENLKMNISFPQSLHILQKIVEQYGIATMLWNQNSSEDILNRIMKEYQLIDLIVKNLEIYRNQVQNCNDCTAVLCGKIAHAQRIQYYVDFLEYIAASPKKFEFTLENFKKLWNILIVNPIHDTDRNPMLDFLVKGGFKMKEDLFKYVFSQMNYPLKQCYKSIEKYFLGLNIKNGSIAQQKSLKVLKYDQIIGLDFFFDVVFFRNEAEQAIPTLIQLHLKTDKYNQVDQKLAMWNTLLDRCKEALKSNKCIVQNVIKCLKDLVTGIEGKQYTNGNIATNTTTKFYIQLQKDERTLKEVTLPSNTTILGVRKHLNQLYNLKEADFDMHLCNYEYRLSQDAEEEYPISIVEDSRQREKPDIMIQNLQQQNKNALFISVRKFKAMLSSNSELSEILFDLLQSENYEDIWEVLTLMPQNKQIKQQLERGANDEDQWSKILYFNCNKKLLYCLQIYETMLIEKRILEYFIRNKGCQSLIGYYNKRQENEFSNLFNLKLFAQIARIISLCNQKEQEINRKCVKYIIAALTKIENKQYQDSSAIQNFLLWNFRIASTENLSDYDLILKSLTELIEPQIRKTLCQQLLEQKNLHKHFLNMGQELSKALNLKNQAEQYLELYVGVLDQQQSINDLTKITKQIPQILIKFLNDEDTDRILLQLFRLMTTISQKCEESRIMMSTDQDLQKAILNNLFNLENRILQNQETRKAAYEVVRKLFANQTLMQHFETYFECAYWRSQGQQNWSIVQTQTSRSRTGFAGLKNLGCICYMNSLMQQLFTLPSFRDCILSMAIESKQQSVLYQFQLLLSALKNSQKQYYDPRNFCNVLGPDGSPINVQEQMDVDEFFLQLMDKLETELKLLQRDMVIRKNFGGFLSTEFISKGCQHRSSREELFLALTLQVKNKKNIYESLRMMTDGEMLEGDNAYQCEKCEKKVPALMRVCIKQLPNVLIMVMKRFEFNYENLQKFKLNDYYEFPTQLNMKTYTKEFLAKQDFQERDDTEAPPEQLEYSDEYYEYQLRGVIIHVGTADSGHYYSLIKDGQSNQWNEFNDTLIKPFDFNDLPNEAFGSDDKSKTSFMSRSKNAYMLFYERKTYFDENGKPLKSDQDLRWFFNNNKKEKQNDEILQDNIKFQISQIMFDEGFFDFSCALLQQGHEISIARFCLQYFLTVVVRFAERGNFIPKYLDKLKQLTRSNLQLATDFLISIQNQDVLQELFIQNPIQDMKVFIGGLVCDAIKCINETEKYVNYSKFKTQSILIQFSKSMLYYANSQRNTEQIWRSLYQISLSENGKSYLKELKTVGRIILYILEEPCIGAGYIELQEPNIQQKILKINNKFIESQQSQQSQNLNCIQFSKFDNSIFDYTYMVMVLNQLIQQEDDDEICMLADPMVIKKLLAISYTRLARIALKDILQKYIVINEDPWQQTLNLATTIYEFLRECDEKDLKTGLIALKAIGEVDDAYSEQRLILAAETILLLLKDNLGYWLFSNVIFDYIFKIASNKLISEAIRNVLEQNKSVSKLLQQWLKESSNPYQNFNQQRWKLYKKRTVSLSPLDFNEKLNKFQILSQKRIEMLDKIMSTQTYESGYDSDQTFQLSNTVDVIIPLRTYGNNYDNSGYQTWTIVQNLGDMADLRSTSGITKWVFLTESSLAPPNTQTIKYENHVFLK